MKRLRWAGVVAVSLLGAGCKGKEVGEERPAEVEAPRLEGWDLPMTDRPELTAKSVSAVYVDRKGVLWIGSDNGLSAFDAQSKRWQTYTEADGLVSNSIRIIMEDRDGAIWVGTDRGAGRLDRDANTWKTHVPPPDGTGAKDTTVYAILQDEAGSLWFGTEGRVARLDIAAGIWKSFVIPGRDPQVRALSKTNGDTLWVGRGNGVTKLDTERGTLIHFAEPDQGRSDPIYHGREIVRGRDGALWFGTTYGISKFEPASHEWKLYQPNNFELLPAFGSGVVGDEQNTLWYRTSRGICRFEPATETWTTYTKWDGLADDNVTSSSEGRNGALWFGTRGGVSQFNIATRTWSSYSMDGHSVTRAANRILRDDHGFIWLQSLDGLRRIDLGTGQWTFYSAMDHIFRGNVYDLSIDGEGALWLATASGAVRFVPSTGDHTTYVQPWKASNRGVYVTYHDREGLHWFVTADGVATLDPKANSWVSYDKDSFSSHHVTAIHQDRAGAMWFGTDHAGVVQFKRGTGTWKTYRKLTDVYDSSVLGFIEYGGSVWSVFEDGISIVSEGAELQEVGVGLVTRSERAISDVLMDTNDTTLWLATRENAKRSRLLDMPGFDDDAGIVKFDVESKKNTKYLESYAVDTLGQERPGSFWLQSGDKLLRVVLGESDEAGTLTPIDHRPPLLTQSGTTIALTRPSGLSFIDTKNPEKPKLTVRDPFPTGASTTVLAPGPPGFFWAGTTISGLTLRSADKDLQITRDQGLPSMTVTALAPIPGTDGKRVWVGTTAGPAIAWVEGDTLHAQAIRWENTPTGPVDAITALEDGTAFVAYNPIPEDRFLDPNVAKRRSVTHVFHIDDKRLLENITFRESTAKTEIRALAYSATEGLWAGTSAGLFIARKSKTVGHDRFEPESAQGRLPPMPIRHLRIAPDHTLWMSGEKQGETPPSIVGYRPGTGWIYTLTQELGIPKGNAIDDMSFDDAGNLLVRVGTKLAKGKVSVPAMVTAPRPAFPWPFALLGALLLVGATGAAASQRRQHYLRLALADQPLSAWTATLDGMRRFRVLRVRWDELGLPRIRIPTVRTLSAEDSPGPDKLQALATLLGMEGEGAAPVEKLPHGLALLPARLNYPAPLRNRVICLVSIDTPAATQAEPQQVRATLQEALEKAGQPFELPYVLIAREKVADDLLPPDLGGLRLAERELKALLLSRHPQETFAGLLHARGLLALSPYSTAGAVKDERMFFGRTALLKELLLAGNVQQIIVGPRRVGKTSLLGRLQRELQGRRSEVEPVFLDLLGVTDPARAAERLARVLKTKVPNDAPEEIAFVEVLRRHIEEMASAGARRKVVLLVDEADGLIEADAKAGFPLMSAMRTMQAEEECAFVLAGYLYLYRETLNQRSPLYNFSTVRVLGPLERDAAIELSTEPMEHIGVSYADQELPQRIVDETGGYPNFVQLVCHCALEALRNGKSIDLTLREEHIAAAEQAAGRAVRETFEMNASEEARRIVLALLDRDDFSTADAEAALGEEMPQEARREAASTALQQLRLFGFVVEQEGRMRWAIPLLRKTLQTYRGAENA